MPASVAPERRRKAAEAMSGGQQVAPAVNGFLNLHKPVGITSMEALRRVKRITGQRKKVGHAGTIDPLAEGVLPICFGQATRLMEQVVSGWKRYRMTMRLGAASTTYDAEGDITEIANPEGLTREEIAAALDGFVGRIEQVPPMYSAIKVDGRRLYELARSGKEVERAPRQVEVSAISIDEIALPYLRLTVDCGKGTYLRSIAHDLGEALGCGGYVTQLSRLSCGQFKSESSVTLESLAEAADEDGNCDGWQKHLHPVDWALRELAPMTVTGEEERAIGHGQGVSGVQYNGAQDEHEQRRAYSLDGVFLAILEYRPESGLWQPTRVFRGSAPSQYAPEGLN